MRDMEKAKIYQRKYRLEHPDLTRRLSRESYQRHKEARREYARKYRLLHLAQVRAYFKKWFLKNREYKRAYDVALRDKKYGVALPNITTCGLCGRTISKENHQIHRDHDKKTGRFRGFLCSGCNSRLGWFENRPRKVLSWIHRKKVKPKK